MIDYKMIGSRIREKRIEKGLTQESLAEIMNISPEYMSKIENARVEVNLKRLAELSSILECPIEYLIVGSVMQSPAYMVNELVNLVEGLSVKEKDIAYKVIKLITSLNE